MEDILLYSSSIDKYESLDWSGGRIENIWHTLSCIVIPSEYLDSLSEDSTPLSSFFFFGGGINRALEIQDGTHEVGCMDGTHLDLVHGGIGGCLSILEDLREEVVFVVRGRHEREEMTFLSLVRLLLSCKTFPPWS